MWYISLNNPPLNLRDFLKINLTDQAVFALLLDGMRYGEALLNPSYQITQKLSNFNNSSKV